MAAAVDVVTAAAAEGAVAAGVILSAGLVAVAVAASKRIEPLAQAKFHCASSWNPTRGVFFPRSRCGFRSHFS